ncbi:MAG: patatin family protein, partial [Desulfobulbaceae bacterium]|nr:patatin family protein [Desulfobulbaceae bacterium]
YEEYLYRQVEDGKGNAPRAMPDLLIEPADHQGRQDNRPLFRPQFGNWQRRAKVPVLVVNATSLNTGHNWQFSATRMGEPTRRLGGYVDKNAYYPPVPYKEAPSDDLQRFRLGHAVASSSCVPGLFEPLAISKLYKESTVQLVDGGVHDNQGSQGLLANDCTVLLCSDASGQMDDNLNPSDSLLGVLSRTSDIQADRIREAEYQDLKSCLEHGAMRGFFFVHLKKDLQPHVLDWKKETVPNLSQPDTPTQYGIAADLQQRLAEIRTDLDSFTEVEAYSLMCSGYLMTRQHLQWLREEDPKQTGFWKHYQMDTPSGAWPFLALEPLLGTTVAKGGAQRAKLDRQLEVGKDLFLKAWQLVPALKWLGIALLILAGLGIIYSIGQVWTKDIGITWGHLWVTLLLAAAGFAFPVVRMLSPEQLKRSFALRIVVATLGWVAANFHLLFIDRIFITQGKLDRLLEKKK